MTNKYKTAKSDTSEATEPTVRNTEINTFKQQLAIKRISQISSILELKTYKNEILDKMLTRIATKRIEVLSAFRVILETSGIAHQSLQILPKDERIKTSISRVLENTCFVSDLLLNFSNYMHTFLNKHKDLDVVFRWCLTYSHNLVSDDLIDENTRKLYKLAMLELYTSPKEDTHHHLEL